MRKQILLAIAFAATAFMVVFGQDYIGTPKPTNWGTPTAPIGSGEIQTGAITAAKIATGAVETTKLATDSVSNTKLLNDASSLGKVSNQKMFANATGIGIGTTAPVAALDVNGSVAVKVNTMAEFNALTPGRTGELRVCSDCPSVYAICVSTDTTIASWVDGVDGNVNCGSGLSP